MGGGGGGVSFLFSANLNFQGGGRVSFSENLTNLGVRVLFLKILIFDTFPLKIECKIKKNRLRRSYINVTFSYF